MSDLLSQEEIDALLSGVDSGAIETEAEQAPPGTVQPYDFTEQDRIVRGRLPTLEMVNERFMRYIRNALFGLLRRNCDVSVLRVRMSKFSDYVHGLAVPTSLNLVKIKPLRGTALIVFEPTLVFTVIDNFFGGDGRYKARIEGRDFTATEQRVIEILLQEVFKAMREAWQPVLPIDFEFRSSEINPQFASIVSPTETVVISRFKIELEGGAGEIHLTMPYAMVEPIRGLLDAGVQSDRADQDERWIARFQDDALDAPLELVAQLPELPISIGDFLDLRPGDVIPIEVPDLATVFIEDVPVLRGKVGVAGGSNALSQLQPIQRREAVRPLVFKEVNE